jgi:hypothetical protein
MKGAARRRQSERGGAGVKFLVVLAVLVLAGNAGLNYIPVVYDAQNLKTDMQTAVVQGLALPGKMNPVDNVKTKIQRSILDNNIPAEAFVDVKQTGNSLTARVAYTKQVNILPFGIYRYAYQFDTTASPTGFLLKP